MASQSTTLFFTGGLKGCLDQLPNLENELLDLEYTGKLISPKLETFLIGL
jgi:hypothetical protein